MGMSDRSTSSRARAISRFALAVMLMSPLLDRVSGSVFRYSGILRNGATSLTITSLTITGVEALMLDQADRAMKDTIRETT